MKFSSLFTLLVLSITVAFGQVDSYEKEWASIDTLEHFRKINAAIKATEALIQKAQLDSANPSAKAHYIKASIYKFKYEVEQKLGSHEGLTRYCFQQDLDLLSQKLEGLLATTKDDVTKSMLHYCIADILLKYRSNYSTCNYMEQPKSVNVRARRIDDTDPWNEVEPVEILNPFLDSINLVLKTLELKITHHLVSSASFQKTKKIPASDFKVLLENSQFLDTLQFNFSLYDLLLDNVIWYFKGNARYLPYINPNQVFPFRDSLAFVPAEDFVQFDFTVEDRYALRFEAYKFYQKLLQAHLNDKNLGALAKFDFERLLFAYEHGNQQINKTQGFFLERLISIEQRYASSPFSSTIAYEIGKNLIEQYSYYGTFQTPYSRWNLKTAYDICTAAIQRHPNSIGAKNCQIVINKILQKELRLELESATPIGKPMLMNVHSKNMATIHCKLLPLPLDYHQQKAEIHYYNYKLNKDSAWTAYIQKIDNKNATIWSVAVPNSGDFRTHSVEYAIPAQQAGAYLLLLSDKENFAPDTNGLVYAYLQVSDLSFIHRTRKLEEKFDEFFVVNRNNGAPVKNAKVTFYNTDYKEIGKTTSSDIGYFSTEKITAENFTFKVENGSDFLHLNERLNENNHSHDIDEERNFFFLDRSIYRPGQTVYYKGILTELLYNGTSKILPNEELIVTLYDANGEEISNQELVTNEYGSYSGHFELPTSGLLGQFYIDEDYTFSEIYFNVEEYKKPTFEFSMTSSWKEGATIDSLIITGKAATFSKMPLAGAQVRYTILRSNSNNYYDDEFGYYYGNYRQVKNDTLLVATTTIQDNGSFVILLETATEKDTTIAGYNYTVLADVIDLSGETHSTSVSNYHENRNYYPWKTQQEKKANLETINVLIKPTFSLQNKRSKKCEVASFEAIANKGDGTESPEKISGKWIIEQLKTPEHAQIERLWTKPDTSVWTKEEFKNLFPLHDYAPSERALINWTILDTVYQQSFENISEMKLVLNNKKWAKGFYRLTFKTLDRFQENNLKRVYLALDDVLPTPMYNKVLNLYNQDENNHYFKGQPKDTIQLSVGSYFDDAHVLLELENYRRVHEYRWLQPKRQQNVPIILEEKHRGNLHLRLTSVYNNRLHSISDRIYVPWSNKELKIEYLTFRDNLLPGQDEEWTIKITGPDGKAVAAEVLASMYDAALDKLKPQDWRFDVYETQNSHTLENWSARANVLKYDFNVKEYRHWQLEIPTYQRPSELSLIGANSIFSFNDYWFMNDPNSDDWDMDGVPNIIDKEPYSPSGYTVDKEGMTVQLLKMESERSLSRLSSSDIYIDGVPQIGLASIDIEDISIISSGIPAEYGDPKGAITTKPENFGDVKVRSNLKETVFFYPHLSTAEDGSVSIKFKMSESLSKWKLMLATHNKELQTSLDVKELITQKKLMVMPSAPRFLRQGDEVEISSKISNLSKENLTGKITLQLFHADSEEAVDIYFDNNNSIQDFELKQGGVNVVQWRLRIPQDWATPILYRIIAKAGDFSDGEQNSLPVVSNKTLITEALPLLVHGKSTQDYVFNSFKNNNSKTLQHHQLTLELTPNPAWDAVLSLPYLMEYPYECSEQLFSRFYANSLATQIVNSTPKIQQVFEQWAGSTTEPSSLDKLLANPTLKSALLEETPWVVNAQDAATKRKHIGQLFEMNKMAAEFAKVRDKLVERQGEDGGFAWFTGGSSDAFITQYIVGGMEQLQKLGANPLEKDDKTTAMIQKAKSYMDKAFVARYNNLKSSYDNRIERKKDKDAIMIDDNLDYNTIQYLYTKSFAWQKDSIEKDTALTLALNYYLNQISFHWRNKSLYHQGMLALAVQRIKGDSKLALTIVDSLKNKAIIDKDKGMFWTTNWGYNWYQLPIETQALMIEVFAEVAKDEQAVYNLKLWLLQNKKGAAWASTKATTTACYALLMGGEDWLSEGQEIAITMGGKKIEQAVEKEAGTGYVQLVWNAADIKSDMATISLNNPNPSPAFGAVYWQYFEEFDNVKSFKDTPLKITKELFVQENTKEGVKNIPLKEQDLKQGDLINVRIELEVGTAMEYVHLKDMRAAGFEPINVLSGYKWNGRLGYYEMTKDVSTNFFFSYLPRGKYIFEYPLRVNYKGDFSNGVTTIQSMYAPEFTSHSEGIRVKIN